MWLAVVVAFGALAWLRDSLNTVRGDEGTYLAMAESLALDGDLTFDERDRDRIEASPQCGRKSVILQRSGDRITYSKPVMYAVAAAPFYRLFGAFGSGAMGLVVLNLAFFGAALALAAAYLRNRFPDEATGPVLATFAGVGVLPAYVAWCMSDLFQASLVLAGLVLALAVHNAGSPSAGVARSWSGLLTHRWAPLAGGVCLGLVAAARYPHLLVAAAPVAVLVLARKTRPAALVAAGVALGFGLALLANLALAGNHSPYRAPRTTFHADTGYPTSPEDPIAVEQLEAHPATQTMGIKPRLEPRVSAYSALYFLAGRHTGLVLYFPAALLLAGFALPRPDRQTVVLLLALAGLAAFYLIWLPRNYFGGGSFVGNRYFLIAYPLVLPALARLPGRRILGVAWGVGILVWLSAVVSVATSRDLAGDSQNHAYAGLFRIMPYESTARLIEGRRDRYWRDDFLRFDDPWAEVGPEGPGPGGSGYFDLVPGGPAAEVLLATVRESGRFLFEVESEAPEVWLSIRDRGSESIYRIGGDGNRSHEVIELDARGAWRVHPFWWSAEVCRARALRFGLAGPEELSAPVRVRYAGDAQHLDEMFLRVVHRAPLPETHDTTTRTSDPPMTRPTT